MGYKLTDRDIWEIDSALTHDKQFMDIEDFNEQDKYRLQKVVNLAMSKEIHWHYDGGMTSYILNH